MHDSASRQAAKVCEHDECEVTGLRVGGTEHRPLWQWEGGHILARSLSKGIGERAFGRVDDPCKDHQKQTAVASKQQKESRVADEFSNLHQKMSNIDVDRCLLSRCRWWPRMHKSSFTSHPGLGFTKKLSTWPRKAK